jgi:hypothetical protein
VDWLAGEIRERGAAPQPQRGRHILGRMARAAVRKRTSRRRHEPREPLQVDLLGCDRQAVAGPVSLDERGAERLAEAVHVDLQRRHGRARRLLAPELVDESLSRNNFTGRKEQRRQQGALFRRAQCHRLPVDQRFDRAEDAEFHAHIDALDAFRAHFKALDC